MIKKRRIFLGLTEIAGFYTKLSRGLQEQGVDCLFADLDRHPYQYADNGTKPIALLSLVQTLKQRTGAIPRTDILIKTGWWISYRMLFLVFFLYVIARYHVFILCYGSTFFSYYELPLLKMLGKKIIYVFHGTDSRPPYIDGTVMRQPELVSIRQCLERTARQKRNLMTIERYADAIICNPLSAQLHEKPAINFFSIGLPAGEIPGAESPPPGPARDDGSGCHPDRHAQQGAQVTILHSPSNPEVKGTAWIRRAVTALQAKGHAINFIEITDKPNAEVLVWIDRCDFVVDQLYADTPMAGFTVEAAKYGKPAIVGGYACRENLHIAPEDYPPSLFCHPTEIEAAIEKMITDRAYRQNLGLRAQQFVTSKWSTTLVAQRFLMIIDQQVPDPWMFDPRRITYLHGHGMPETQIREIVRALVSEGGPAALHLADKPVLERLYLAFASSSSAEERS